MSLNIVLMSNYKIGSFDDILSTNFLGSCISVVLYDKYKKIGALSHSLLSSSNNNSEESTNNSFRYVDKVIPILIKEMTSKGSCKNNIKAMLFGGANMSTFSDFNLNIGENNISKSKELLRKNNIPIVFEDTGGNLPRTIFLDCSNGSVLIKKPFINDSLSFLF